MNVQEYLRACRELNRFCSQNGWIDNDTLEVQIVAKGPDRVTAAVQFEEVIMEGAGCIAGRVPCFGQIRLHVDPGGNVLDVEFPD